MLKILIAEDDQELCQLFSHVLTKHGYAVTYYGNEPLMRHVWSNLLSNAVKFSPRGGLVQVGLRYIW